MCQAYEAGGLEIVDVRSFLSALKIGCLKRILCDNGKITQMLQIMCPWFKILENVMVNLPMQRVGSPFWKDVSNIITFFIICVLNEFLQPLMNLLQKIIIMMLILAEIKKKSYL